MNDILKEEFKRIIETGEAEYENTPPFIVFDEKYRGSGTKYPVYILKDDKVLRPRFNPLYCFFKLDIRDYAALLQAYAHGAKDAFRDFVLEFFESKIQKRVNIRPHAFLLESHGKKWYKKSSAYFLKEVELPNVKRWKRGIYINSDPVFFFNWAVQEKDVLRVFYFGAKGYTLGKLTNEKLADLTTASLGYFNAKYKVKEYIPGIPFI